MLDDAGTFLAEAGPLLLEDETRHNLILGVGATILADPGLYELRRFWIVQDGAGVVAAALRTPPHNLVLARPRSEAALDLLVAAIDEQLPGVVAAVPEVDAFTHRWALRHGVGLRTVHRHGIYALERLQPVPRPEGGARRAAIEDVPLVLDWARAFAHEALHGEDPDLTVAGVEHRLRSPEAGFLLWDVEGEVVSLAGWGGRTPNGIRVGPVYTPPARRGRGYATALVADLSAEQLAAGRRFCFLYTDLANPTANAIYERIGYVRACDSAQVAFDPLERAVASEGRRRTAAARRVRTASAASSPRPGRP